MCDSLTDPAARFANPCWTEDRKRLLEWLNSKARRLADLYEGAVSLLFAYPIPGQLRFVAHAIREIVNRLPSAVAVVEEGYLQYPERIQQISDRWRVPRLPGDLASGSSVGTEPPKERTDIDRDVLVLFAQLVDEHDLVFTRQRVKHSRFFQAIAPENADREAELRPFVDMWMEAQRYFTRRAHVTNEEVTYNRDEFVQRFELIERTLLGAVGDFAKPIGGLREILEDTNG